MPVIVHDPFGGDPYVVTWRDVLDGFGLAAFLFIVLYVIPMMFQSYLS